VQDDNLQRREAVWKCVRKSLEWKIAFEWLE
jgi:hypothetical protein